MAVSEVTTDGALPVTARRRMVGRKDDDRDVAVSIVGLTKEFGEVRAVDDVSLNVPQGEFVTLVGPSGCGKTTLLRMIAGLETPTAGEISLDGSSVFSATSRVQVPPHRRKLGMVFQSYALWPHMNAFENVAFPLRRDAGPLSRLRKRSPVAMEIRDKVNEVLNLVGCENLAARHPSEMSGGQQQRIALARAIVNSPRIVLMDEPLSNLDAKLRSRLQFELRNLQQRLGFTAVYVTHDRAEALSMADTVVVLNSGRLEQIGPPRDIYEAPQSNYVSDFLGDHNLVPGIVESAAGSQAVVSTSLGRFEARAVTTPAPGAAVRLGVPRDALMLEPVLKGSGAECAADVVGVSYCGWYSEVLVRPDSTGEELTVRLQGESTFDIGDRVRITPNGRMAHLELTDSASG